MSDFDLTKARVTVYEPSLVNRQTVLATLYGAGFQDIDVVTDIEAVPRILDREIWDVVVVDVTDPESDVYRMLPDLRRGFIGANPFAALLGTTWNVTPQVIQQSVAAGVDDLIARPFSIGQIAKRMDGFIKHRRDFMVSAEYVGPEQKGMETSGDLIRMEIPNTLRGRTAPSVKPYNARLVVEQAQAVLNGTIASAYVVELKAAFLDLFESGKTAVSAPREWQRLDEALRRLADFAERYDMREINVLSGPLLKFVAAGKDRGLNSAQLKELVVHLLDAMAVAVRPGQGGKGQQDAAAAGIANMIIANQDRLLRDLIA